MSRWPRLTLGAVLVCALAPALPSSAHAQGSPEQRAEQLNDEGKQLFSEKKYFEAYKKFKAATVLTPNPKFYFNVCFTLNYLERYQDAITACEAVKQNNPDAELLEKTDRVIAALRQKLPPDNNNTPPDNNNNTDPNNNNTDPNNTDPNNTNNTDPNNTNNNTPPPNNNNQMPPSGNGPVDDPFAEVKKGPDDNYKWAFGGELSGIANLGIGDDIFDKAGGGFRLFANFVINEQRRLGLQAYLAVTNFEADGDAGASVARLNLLDIGGAIYWHRPLAKRIYWTPLIGAALSFQSDSGSEAFIAPALRAEVKLSFLFGQRGQHELSVTPALNIYGAANEAGADLMPSDVGLDTPGATFGVNFGYTIRFDTPFGATPLITLE